MAYSASKFAMGFTNALMQEVRGRNKRVTALARSTVNTELAKSAGLKIGDKDHMMEPEDFESTIKDADRFMHLKWSFFDFLLFLSLSFWIGEFCVEKAVA